MSSRAVPRAASTVFVGTGSLLFVCSLLVASCASSAVARRIAATDDVVERATQRGAAGCAPEELALSRANLEFARLELAQGDVGRAERHLTLAEPNAKASLRLASEPACRTGPLSSLLARPRALSSLLARPRALSSLLARPRALSSLLARPRALSSLLARPRARFDPLTTSPSRLYGAVGGHSDLGRGAP